MLQEARRFISEQAEQVGVFFHDEKSSKLDYEKLYRLISIALLGLAISGCNVAPVKANESTTPKAPISQIYLPLALNNYPNERIPQINGSIQYQPNHPSKSHVWKWEINVRDGDYNLLEFCTLTSDRPEEECTVRPPNIKQWGAVSAVGYIYHSVETNCASIKAEATDEEGNRSLWRDENCLTP